MTRSLRFFSHSRLRAFSLLLLLLGTSLLAPAQTIRYVRTNGPNTNPATATTWATSTTNLQGAIDASGTGDQVWVAQGTYKPGGYTNTDRSISFSMKSGVTIYGGFAPTGSPALTARNPSSFTTVLSGDIGTAGNSADNSYHVVYNAQGQNASAVLDGFVIRDGSANESTAVAPEGAGGGMYNEGSGPTLINCRFMTNYGFAYGGGMYNRSSSPTLTNCSFMNNNSSFGGGMYDGGGSSPTLTNCSFMSNGAGFGGAISNDSGNPTLTNCSFFGNDGSETGSVIYNIGGVVTLTNCVLFGNVGPETITPSYREYNKVTIAYSLLETGVTNYIAGGNNLTTAVSPFVSTTDARLKSCAPAINAGLNSANSTTTDLGGNSRIVNNRIDMGAYEYQGSPTPPLAITQQPPSGSAVCPGSTVSIPLSASGTGTFTYQLIDAAGTPVGPSQSTTPLTLTNGQPARSGSYSVVVTGLCNSVISTAFSLTVNALPVAQLTASPSTVLSCAQTRLTLTAGGGSSYAFSGPGVISQNGNQAMINAPGTYSVNVTNAGCTSTTSIAISQDNAAPSASLASSGPISCTVTSVTLTASPGGQTGATLAYRFSAGANPVGTTNQATVTTAGVYSVTVLAGNGCSSVASTTVTGDRTAPGVSITPTSGTLTCANPTLTLTANTSAPTLRWSNGQTTPSIIVNASGSYSVTATGSNGCSTTSNPVTIESSQSAPPATLVASGGLSCAVTSVTLTANTGNGLSYRFSPGATQVETGNTATVNALGPYSVTVTNTATGCTSTANVVVGQDNSQPTVSISPSSASLSCGLPTATLTANTSASSLLWSTGQTTNSISVSVAGTYSVTVTSANGCQAVAQAIVSGTTDAPTAPTLAASPATTTSGQPITVTANGCTGGTITWTALGGTGQASGNTYTLTQPGNYTLSATCSLNGCTSPSSAPLALQIRPGGFAITGVSMVSCQLVDEAKGGYQVQFTPQYAGQNDSPVSFSIVNELATTTALAPYTLRLYTDNPVITLVAAQAGNGEARFAYNWRASCQSGTSPNRPPITTGIPSQTIVQGQAYQLQLTAYFTDLDGQALTFQASGLPAGLSLTGSVISGTPTQTGVSSVNVTAIDPGGLQVSTSFQLTAGPMPVTPPSGFAIVGVSTVQCQVLSPGERQLTFTPQYAGVSGAPISFSVVNELRPTTAPGPYTLRLYTDNPAITLSVQQGSAVSTYRYNWLAVCNPAGRVGLGEAESMLVVRVLGNPLTGDMVQVQVQGADGQPVQVSLTNLQGQLVSERSIQQAGPMESLSLPVASQPAGLLILRVSTPTQNQTLKVLKR